MDYGGSEVQPNLCCSPKWFLFCLPFVTTLRKHWNWYQHILHANAKEIFRPLLNVSTDRGCLASICKEGQKSSEYYHDQIENDIKIHLIHYTSR